MVQIGTWLLLLFNLICVIHIIRRGKEIWWILIILFFPGLGSLFYFFMEMLPDLRRGDLRRDMVDMKDRFRTAEGRIAALKKELQSVETVEKRVELAEAYAEAERWDDAVETYLPCIEGPLGDDPFLLYGYARVRFNQGSLDFAREALDKIDQSGSRDKINERKLLKARLLHRNGKSQEALPLFEEVVEISQGEEARFYFAEYLIDQGKPDEGRAILEDMLDNQSQHSGLYRKTNREWFGRARQILERLK